MRWLAVLGLVAFGCAPVDSEPQGSQRQAFMGPPQLEGPDGGRLGAALAPCRTSGFVAGAPGVGSAKLDVGGSAPTGSPGSYGKAVACEGIPSARRILSGGEAGLSSYRVTPPMLTSVAGPVVALALSPQSTTLPLLVGKADGGVRFVNPVTLAAVAPDLPGTTGSSFGAALAWFPGSSPRFVVGSPGARQVDLYDFLPDAGVVHVSPSLSNLGRAGFGLAVAVGDVSPNSGLEVIIGSEGAVDVYEQNGTLIHTLSGTSTSFGAAVAVEEGWAAAIDRLWVGEPSLDRIHSFVGDAGTIDDLDTPGVRFGASLLVDRFGSLAVGAPEYPSGSATPRGAVFSLQARLATAAGEVGDCDVGLGCLGTLCRRGTCRGGVFCEGMINACPGGAICDVGSGLDQCLLPDGGVFVITLPARDAGITVDAGAAVDAGVLDAGVLDAGVIDAGVIDAGVIDAGVIDAGVIDAGVIDAGVDAGVVDAGVVDAGVVDAGGVDAGGVDAGAGDSGVVDAGGVDAGAGDSGVVGGVDAGGSGDGGDDENYVFATRSCSSSSLLPMVMISLLLARRKRCAPNATREMP